MGQFDTPTSGENRNKEYQTINFPAVLINPLLQFIENVVTNN